MHALQLLYKHIYTYSHTRKGNYICAWIMRMYIIMYDEWIEGYKSKCPMHECTHVHIHICNYACIYVHTSYCVFIMP